MFSKVAVATAALASLASAQTFTSCDPTKKSCPADPALGSQVVNVDFRNGPNSFFNVAEGTNLTYDKDLGAIFSIANENQAPTITSSKYIFFGKVDVVIKASLGVGVVTSVTMQSDDLDEIDWEWLGGDSTQVQTNFFSKGCTDVYDRGGYSSVSDPQHNFDTYTINWTPQSIQWIINGNVVRTLTATSASGCDGFPQTPMQLKLGTWVAGKPDNPPGTIEWAGGVTDFSTGPFYGYYQSVTVQDYMGSQGATDAGQYSYGDQSGTWQSIKINGESSSGESTGTTTTTSASSTKASTVSSSVSSKTSVTTLTTVTSSVQSTTTLTSAFTNGTKSTATGTSAPSTTVAASASATASTTPKNAGGKIAGSLLLAGAGVFAALFL